MQYLSFLYWGFNLLIKIEYAGTSTIVCAPGAATADAAAQELPSSGGGQLPPGCREVWDMQAALQLPSDPNASPVLDACMLVAMLVAIRLAVYLTLRVKTRPR